MTRRKRRHTGAGSYDTASRRALANPHVTAAIKKLRTRWKRLDKIERGERLRELATQGCSTRGLGKKLRKAPTSIVRYIELAKLPLKARDAIKAGASAKKILALKALVNRKQRLQKRIDDDQKIGKLSDHSAGMILQFCRTTDGVPPTPLLASDMPLFLGNVRLHLTFLETSGHRSVRIPSRLGTVALFEVLCPEEKTEEFWVDHRARWLAIIIYSKTPERPIWERSLEKAAARAFELNQPKTPEEVYEDGLVRRLLIDLLPSRRSY
jgi:hypothetical protein